jgi:citrate lyase subunit beta/citryl-CoA lyase
MVQVIEPRLRRSLLFVPGAEPRKLEKARGAGADTLMLDLEDSVAPQQKAEARANVAEVLRAGGFAETEAAVRVNAPASPDFEADLEAVVGAGGTTILLPKCESAEGLVAIAAKLDRLDQSRAVKLLALVESPSGVVNVSEIATATPRLEALCFGHADFCLEMGLTEADSGQGVAFHARCSVAIAAKAARVAPIDCVHLGVKDPDAFRRDAELGQSLGYEGKLCIHPSQVEIVNQIYTPSAEQIEHALRVMEGWQQAESEGRGVFTLDGKMIDAPIIAVQQRVLDRARRAGVLGD